MKNVLEYKGYTGPVEFSAEDAVFFGKIIGIKDVITFDAAAIKNLIREFNAAVDDYLKTCIQLGKKPDKEFKGSLNVRLKPHLHRLAVINSTRMKIPLNTLVERAIEKEVLGTGD